MLARSEQRWRDRDVKLVDKAGTKILLDCSNTAAKSDVLATGCLTGALKSYFDVVGDEVKHRATLHCKRRASMMSQHEDVAVIGWFVAPPAFPVVVRPRTAHWPEHVAAENPRADILKAAGGEIVVRPGRAAVFAEQHLLKRPCWENPLMQRQSADPQRI